jgi:hypothetical protein
VLDEQGVSLKSFGAMCDGIHDDTLALQTAVDTSSDHTTIYLPKGPCKITSTIYIRRRGIKLIGYNYGRKEENASIIQYSGTGELFKLADENTGYYAGYQGFQLKDVSLVYTGTARSKLLNPYSIGAHNDYYGTGTYAMRDWRGGGIVLDGVQIEHFEFGLWGTQSDINRLTNVNLYYNKEAIHLEEGSDQLKAEGLYTFGNDKVLSLTGLSGARFTSCQFVKEGTPTSSPIDINDSNSILFSGCWFEGLGSANQSTIPSYIRLGYSAQCKGVTFRDSTLAIPDKIGGLTPVCNYFVEVVNAKRVLVDEIGGYPANLKKVIAFSGNSSTQQVVLRSHLDITFPDGTYHDNNGTGKASILVEKYDENGRQTIGMTFLKAYLPAQQPIPANTWTKVRMEALSYDDLSEWDVSGSKIIAKQSGKYRVSTFQITNQQAAGNRMRLGIFVDAPDTGGSALVYLDDTVTAINTNGSVSGTIDLKLNAGQSLDIRMLSIASTSLPGGGASNYVTITRI